MSTSHELTKFIIKQQQKQQNKATKTRNRTMLQFQKDVVLVALLKLQGYDFGIEKYFSLELKGCNPEI